MSKTKKILLATLAALLLVAVSVGGTLAYLTATSNDVENTFTATELGVVLDETKTGEKWEKPLLPGATYDKDPHVTLAANSVDAWVFVEIVEKNNALTGDAKKVTYEISDEWVKVADAGKLTDSVGVWMYKTAPLKASNTAGVYLLKNGTDNEGAVTVNPDLTANDMNPTPTITFHAYALQSENLKVGTVEINASNAASNGAAMWQLVAQ